MMSAISAEMKTQTTARKTRPTPPLPSNTLACEGWWMLQKQWTCLALKRCSLYNEGEHLGLYSETSDRHRVGPRKVLLIY
jgi:hypothetical protein